MPETITTLTGLEAVPGTAKASGQPYVRTTFTDTDGKKFKTFNDDIADKGKALIGKLVVVDFAVKQETRGDRTYTDNMINDITDAAEVKTAAASVNGDVAAVSPTASKILAFRAAIDLLVAMPEAFGDTPNFVGIAKVADAIHDWASRPTAAPVDSEPEPEPEMVTN